MTEIPLLTGEPAQSLRVELEGELYNMRITYNERANTWGLDLADVDAVPLASGVLLVVGADLIDAYKLGIGGLFMVEIGTTGGDAGANNLGDVYKLIYLTEQEVEDVSSV
jgi:hypothetical protein